MYELIIIGGGPAGISAGIYAARQKLKTLLISKSFGGQMARKAVLIENYPGFKEISGLELIQKFVEHLKAQRIDILEESIDKIKKEKNYFSVLTESKKNFQAKALIVTSGSDPRPLEVPGEKEFIGKGVSYCTACDGPMFSDKVVAVVGGGDAGFEAGLFLAKYAKKIYILEFNPVIKADEINQKLTKESGKIDIITSAALKEIQGKDFVESIIYQDRQSKKIITLEVQGVFVEIGSIPATSFVKDLVEFNEKDEIKIDLHTNMTKTPGLFAAGDVTQTQWKQIAVAVGEGVKAELSAYNYLQRLNV